jgi:hypothetical protein
MLETIVVLRQKTDKQPVRIRETCDSQRRSERAMTVHRMIFNGTVAEYG